MHNLSVCVLKGVESRSKPEMTLDFTLQYKERRMYHPFLKCFEKWVYFYELLKYSGKQCSVMFLPPHAASWWRYQFT